MSRSTVPNAAGFKKTRIGSETTYSQHKEEYQDKIIDYPDSPTGKAYVGINKSPFMPAADGGYGFQGVLMQDDDRQKVQCHACGKWFSILSYLHLKSCCGLTPTTYKEKYGLNDASGLVSDEVSLKLTKKCLQMKKSVVNRKPRTGRKRGGTNPMSFMNRYGTCPLQLKARLYEFIRCNHELPGPSNRGANLYCVLKRRHGSFGLALLAHGLPWLQRKGTNMQFVFSDGTVYSYNLMRFYDREALFQLMMQKCPVLKEA